MNLREHPILFSAPMVRAILNGTKTQTRRVVKFPRGMAHTDKAQAGESLFARQAVLEVPTTGSFDDGFERVYCPYASTGDDRLWVKETWQPIWETEEPPLDGLKGPDGWAIVYVATDGIQEFHNEDDGITSRCKPSIFMPRWASRITLQVTGVRVERLQMISREDAIAEGAFHTKYPPHKHELSADGGRTYHETRTDSPGWALVPTTGSDECMYSPQYAFANLWNKINAKRGFGWDANPWVWCVEFKRVDGGAK